MSQSFSTNSNLIRWLRFIGVDFWMVALFPFYIGFVISSKTFYSSNLLYGILSICFLTSSTFVLNHILDIELDKQNPRKSFSLLVRNDISSKNSFILFIFLSLFCLLFSLVVNYGFVLCILGLILISLMYNISPFRLKNRPLFDILCHTLSLGILCPIAGWCLSDSSGIISAFSNFPFLYLISISFYVTALHSPTMAVDFNADIASGATTFATKFGAERTMFFSWLLTTAGASILFISGYLVIEPWSSRIFLLTAWLLPLEVLIHYYVLPINEIPTYSTVFRGSIILATVEAFFTLFFLYLYVSEASLP